MATWYVDFGVTHEVFKGKGTLALNVRDVFNSRKRTSIIDSEGLYSRSENQFHPRQILLTLTFRLNKEANGERDDDGPENGDGMEY